MIQLASKKDCCGCSACIQRCPKNCISLVADEEGFLYPKTDNSICVNCGICASVCPTLNVSKGYVPMKAYAAFSEDEEILNRSSSGGIFSMIANLVICNGGIVFGASYDKDWQVHHTYITKKDELPLLCGSKYLQSRIEHTYKEAEFFLRSGKFVMFTGTPCQVAGLKKYLKVEYSNLLTVDFLCHGVPSPGVWSMYIGQLQKSFGKIESVFFRDKCDGWRKFMLKIKFANNKSLQEHFFQNSYMKLFLNNVILRPSCYNCKFKQGSSFSDITIADFWDIDKYETFVNEYKGISLVLVNSCIGDQFFSKVSGYKKKYNPIDIVMENDSWKNSSKCHEMRRYFFYHYEKINDFNNITEYMFKPPFTIRLIRKFLRMLGVVQMPI